jgi:transcriptional regulator with XRE-family HTH domain
LQTLRVKRSVVHIPRFTAICTKQNPAIAASNCRFPPDFGTELTACADMCRIVRKLAAEKEAVMQEFDAEAMGQIVREEIARRRISRQTLADLAKISLSTLEKALAGTRPFTLATIIRMEEALNTRLRPVATQSASHDFAPEMMGAYSRAGVKWIEGRYLTIRPSFKSPGDLFTYLIVIRWLAEESYLGFAESQRLDSKFEQSGHVSMPNLSGISIWSLMTRGSTARLCSVARRLMGSFTGYSQHCRLATDRSWFRYPVRLLW